MKRGLVTAARLTAVAGMIVLNMLPSAGASAQMTLRFAYPGTSQGFWAGYADSFTKFLAAESAGALRLDVTAGEPMAPTSRVRLQLFDDGEFEITVGDGQGLIDRVPEMRVLQLPLLLRSPDAAHDAMRGAAGKLIADQAARHGYRLLAYTWRVGVFIARKTCVTGPADLQGKLIYDGGGDDASLLRAAGAIVIPTPGDPTFNALQSGQADWALVPLTSVLDRQAWTVTDCLTGPGTDAFMIFPEPIMMREDYWRGLTSDQQAALQKAAVRLADVALTETDKRIKRALAQYGGGGKKTTEMDEKTVAAWRDLARNNVYPVVTREIDGAAKLIDALTAAGG